MRYIFTCDRISRIAKIPAISEGVKNTRIGRGGCKLDGLTFVDSIGLNDIDDRWRDVINGEIEGAGGNYAVIVDDV
jgi:hypothetical protein